MQLLLKRTLVVLLWLGLSLPSYAQQLLCERILSWPPTKKSAYVGGLLRLQADSLRMLSDFQFSSGATSQNATTRLHRVKVSSCDTLPVPSSAFQTVTSSYDNTLGLVTRRGEVLVASADRNTPNQPVRLRLISRAGSIRWTRTLPQVAVSLQLGGLLEAPDRGFFVSIGGLGGSVPTYLFRLDSLGNTVWQRVLSRQKNGGPMWFYDPAYTRSGTIVFHPWYPASGTVPSVGVMEINQNGDSLSTRSTSPNLLQTSNYFYNIKGSLQPLRDGGFVTVAEVDSANTGYYRPFLTRLDANLNVVWSSIYRQQASQQYVFSHPYELADGSLVVLANSTYSYPTTYYLFRYSAAGVLLQRYPFTSPLITSFSNTGFTQPVGLQPLSDSTFMLVSNLRSYVTNGQQVQRTYLAHLKVAGLRRVIDSHYIPAANSPLAARPTSVFPAPAYPNPATETVTVPLLPSATPARLQLLDLTGRLVRAWPVAAGQASATLPVGTVAAGLYLLTLQVPGQPPATQRLAVAW